MTMAPFAYARATSVAEAVEVLSDDCRPLAGGTDLVALMKAGLAAPQSLVSLRGIAALDGVDLGEGGWRIGATATLARVAADPLVAGHEEIACLYEAIVQSASPQLRHMATLGGNLLQKPRCWYYRNPLTHCWRKGGGMCYAFRGENKYHVLFGGGPCYAVHPSDPAVALLALDARVAIVGLDGERTMPLGEMHRLPDRLNRGDTVLGGSDLVTRIDVPRPRAGTRGTYVKVAERAAWDFALVSAAALVTLSGGVVERARIALGGVAPIPWRAVAAEDALVGGPLDGAAIDRAAEAAAEGARPLEDNAYKVDLLRGVAREALGRLATAP